MLNQYHRNQKNKRAEEPDTITPRLATLRLYFFSSEPVTRYSAHSVADDARSEHAAGKQR